MFAKLFSKKNQPSKIGIQSLNKFTILKKHKLNLSNSYHRFENGVKLYAHHVSPRQRKRYVKCNVHEEEEEALFINVVGNLAPKAVFVNIGTAIGYYPILARKMRADLQIHCFEPLPKHIGYLKENLALNQISTDGFFIHEKVVSTSQTTIRFKEKSFGSQIISKKQAFTDTMQKFLTRMLGKTRETSKKLPVLKLKSIPLTSLSDLTGSKYIDLVQMDIQGHELEVLDAYFSSSESSTLFINSFLIGTHGNSIHNSCKKILEKHGYLTLVDNASPTNQPDGILYCSYQK